MPKTKSKISKEISKNNKLLKKAKKPSTSKDVSKIVDVEEELLTITKPIINQIESVDESGQTEGEVDTKSKNVNSANISSQVQGPSMKGPNQQARNALYAQRANIKLEKFKVGDFLVYPMHGVGRITAISKQSILGILKSCYVLEIESSKMKVMVPIENAGMVGIRSIISKKEIQKVIELLQKDEVDTEEDWKIRYQNNMNKIKSGSIYSVAEVCRNLYKRACDRELSLMERRLYESAYKLVSSEIALTKNITLEEAGNMISEVLAT